MAAMASYSLKDLIQLLESGRAGQYPYYCVLIYPPLNGLNQRLHEYVVSHWDYLNGLTGANCLLVAVEDIGRQIGEYQPEEIYAIARLLGADVRDVPCAVFFTQPRTRPETLILRLRDLVPDGRAVTDDELTDLFQSLQSVMDACVAEAAADARLACLREGVDEAWPVHSPWHARLAAAKGAVVPSLTTAGTILQALVQILPIVRGFF
jgi:hypothetical protein